MKNTKAYFAITTPEERYEISSGPMSMKEFSEKHHNPACSSNHPRLLFAFWQKQLEGAAIPYWHVMNDHKSRYSTLSIPGLRQWGVI